MVVQVQTAKLVGLHLEATPISPENLRILGVFLLEERVGYPNPPPGNLSAVPASNMLERPETS